MTTRALRMGVIGVGSHGQHHARICAHTPGVNLVGVHDLDPVRSREVAAQCGTRSWDRVPDLADHIDAATIVVPPDRHLEVAAPLLERGIHLLVEKPIAGTTADAEALVRLARERNLVLQVGHLERFNPVMAYLEKVPGPPRFIEAHRLASYPPPRPGLPPRGTEVSVVLDLMIHDLEVVLHLVRSPVRSFHAVGVPVLSLSEDIANVRLIFENGSVANITASRISPERLRKIRAFYAAAYISLDYQTQSGELYRKKGASIQREAIPIERGDPLTNEIRAFVRCVARHGEPVVTGEQGSQALRLAADIQRTIQESAP
jgi:predicted dehydrogenase